MDARLKFAVSVVSGLLMTASLRILSASALQIAEPTDFTAVQQNVRIVQADISGAHCGGWDYSQSVDGKIPTVIGAPGRKGSFMDNGTLMPEVAASGLAWRDETSGVRGKANGFTFPGTEFVEGFSTVCRIREFGGDAFPYQNDPSPASFDPVTTNNVSCRNKDECAQLCTDLNAWQFPRNFCPDATGKFTIVSDGNCRDVRINANTQTPAGCRFADWHYCCSRAPVDPRANQNGNCVPCTGDGLEDPTRPGRDANGEEISLLNQTGCRQGKTINNRPYISFFRRFLVSYGRQQVLPHVPGDDASRNDIPVGCFGRYEEFDPKIRRTLPKDRRCVVILEEEGKRFGAMNETQLGKGEYGQNSNLTDPSYQHDAARDTRNDLWVNGFGDAFSLLNGRTLQQSSKDHLFPLLQLDSTDLLPTAQLTVQRPFSSGSLIRSTDDSVSNDRPGRRTITEWWQEQETQAHKLFTTPMLRLMLPTPASIGLDLSDPLLTPRGSSSSNGRRIHQQTIDIQIRSSPEDLLSEVSAYLQNSLLIHVQEEPVPLVVPLASPVELRALAQGWKRWGEEQGGEAKAKAEMAALKLEAYAERIDQVRALRGELARYIGRLLIHQDTMMRAIGEWLKGNLQTWERSSAFHQQRLALKPKWEEIQQKYRIFHDRTNMPWCRNDRFTTPIYSLLDDWMPGRPSPRDLKLNIDDPPANDLQEEKFPRLAITALPDLVYDFTALRVSTGTVLLPVLTPIQIRLTQSLFNPPAFYEELADRLAQLDELEKLPDLPPVPSIYQEVLSTLFPTEVTHLSSPSGINPAFADLPPEVEQVMDRISTIITGMDETYKKFWESITEYPNRDIPEKKWDCQNLNTMPCVHVEMDLLERFTRIGARPAVQLKEDFASYGPLRTDALKNPKTAGVLPSTTLVPPTAVPPCPREDWACQVFNVEKTFAREGWRVEGVEHGVGKEDLARLRDRLRKQTIPGNGSNSFPYIVDPDQLLPSFNVPAPLSLPITPSR